MLEIRFTKEEVKVMLLVFQDWILLKQGFKSPNVPVRFGWIGRILLSWLCSWQRWQEGYDKELMNQVQSLYSTFVLSKQEQDKLEQALGQQKDLEF